MTILGIEGFRAASATLGLRLEAPDLPWWKNNNVVMLEGVVDGTRVLVQQGSLRRSMDVIFHAALEPALDLGLGITLRGSYVLAAVGMGPAPLNFPTFERAFDMKAHEPARLQALLTPPLRETLMGWHNARRWEAAAETKNALQLWVNDETVLVRLATNALGYGAGTPALSADALIGDIRATAALARALNEAATHVPPSAMLAPHATAWRAFAAANGLTFFESPLRMSGAFEGVTFSARAAYLGPEGYGVELTMPFARPLPFYLRLGNKPGWFEKSKAYPDSWAEWVSPQKMGDDAFDDALRVVSNDPHAQAALLTPDIRRALLDLVATKEHIHMTTESLTVRTRTKVSPDAFADLLRPMSAIEKMIERQLTRVP